MRVLVAAALVFLVGCMPPSSGPSPTPIPSVSASASSTAQPSPTRRPNVTVGPGTYVSAAVGYRVELPAGWRYSQCQSASDIGGQVAGRTEAFTSASVEDESGTDVGPAHPVVDVRIVDNPTGRTALQWLSDGGMGVGDTFDRAVVDGREGAQVISAGREVTTLVTAARGRIYAITAHGPQGVTSDARGIMNSLHVLDDAELAAALATFATPTPAGARSAEAVADTLARGFSQKDTQVLATVAWACLTRGLQNSGGSFASATRVLDELKQAFAEGATFSVVPRPVTATADYASVESTLTETGKAPRRVALNMLKRGDTWYWMGWIDFRS
jgi:hypothetical protein